MSERERERERERGIRGCTSDFMYDINILHFRIYSQTSMARSSLGPWKFVRAMGKFEPLRFNHGTRSGSKWR